MQLNASVMDDLAACLEYPIPATKQSARSAAKALASASDGQLSQALISLADEIENARVGEPEERYTLLFDLKPVCTLNLGHHIYGDTYQRGALLAGLASDLNAAGIDHGHDLPDFLPTLLRLLGWLDDEEDRRLLVYAVMEPALKSINAALKDSSGPWPEILRLLPALITSLVPRGLEEIAVPKRRLEVLQNA